MFTQSPEKSTQQVAGENGLTRHIILKVLHKELNYRSWKPHYVQKLKPKDCDRRMKYGVMLGGHEDLPKLFENNLWSDEAVFHCSSFANLHNCHYWKRNETDPKHTVERRQTWSKVTVWWRMMASRIIEPYLLHDTMNEERYLDMFESFVWITLIT